MYLVVLEPATFAYAMPKLGEFTVEDYNKPAFVEQIPVKPATSLR